MSILEDRMHAAILLAQNGDPYQGIYNILVSYNNHADAEKEKNCFEVFDFIVTATQGYGLHLISDYVFEHDDQNYTSYPTMDSVLINITEQADRALRINIRNKNKEKFSSWMSQGFQYQFDDKDHDRLQTLIGELRKEIKDFKPIEEEHRQRLLKRLENLQSELNKKISDLDKFWGMVGDAGVVLGKFGSDAKPFVDRIREMTSIIWKAQSEAEGLPNKTELPLLEVSE